MNKKYIDFVPVTPGQGGKTSTKKKTKTVRKNVDITTNGTHKKTRTESAEREVSELELSKMFGMRREKPRAGVTVTAKKKNSRVFEVPKTKFVNTEKVTKRPLSSTKNVYPKKSISVAAPKIVSPEKPSKPVTIINKPEKDSKVGMIVAIIITIILGAAAGTVAFLLLPS